MESHLFELAAESFESEFQARPNTVSYAPGRVNLIGEHTDYNDGFVFPMAIQSGVAIAARPTSGESRVVSSTFGEARFDVNALIADKTEPWARYIAGVAWALQRGDFGAPMNIEAYVSSDLPIGAGVSSSAAVEVATALVWSFFMGLELNPLQLAQIGQSAENGFVGMQCGLMDQLASAAGRAGSAMFVDMRSHDIRFAQMPPDLRVVLGDTGVRHSLVESRYNERRQQCEAACKGLGLSSLRDARLDDLLDRESELDPIAVRRARHVVTENARCQSFFWALQDRNELRIRSLMQASHESLREDFEVTIPELDWMAEACGSAPGCLGSRMTGGGFGGSCVALVAEDRVDAFRRSASNRYEALSGRKAEFLTCEPSEGGQIRSVQ